MAGRIAPKEPEEALHVPGAAVVEDQLVGPPQQPLLALEALVDSELVGRVRPPADLCDPKWGLPVAVLLHHPAKLLERVLDLAEVGAVRMQGRGVEAALHVPDRVEVVEEVPGLPIRVGDHPGEHDPSLRVLAGDRGVGDPQQLRVLAGRWIGGEELRQIGLVPDLPGLDRPRRGVHSELLAVAVRPVAAARSVARHRRLEEVPPCVPVGGALERGVAREPPTQPGFPHTNGAGRIPREARRPTDWSTEPQAKEPRLGWMIDQSSRWRCVRILAVAIPS